MIFNYEHIQFVNITMLCQLSETWLLMLRNMSLGTFPFKAHITLTFNDAEGPLQVLADIS